MKLLNYLSGEWIEGDRAGIALTDPVTGAALVSLSSDGLDLSSAVGFARGNGSTSLKAMTYQHHSYRTWQCHAKLSAWWSWSSWWWRRAGWITCYALLSSSVCSSGKP